MWQKTAVPASTFGYAWGYGFGNVAKVRGPTRLPASMLPSKKRVLPMTMPAIPLTEAMPSESDVANQANQQLFLSPFHQRNLVLFAVFLPAPPLAQGRLQQYRHRDEPIQDNDTDCLASLWPKIRYGYGTDWRKAILNCRAHLRLGRGGGQEVMGEALGVVGQQVGHTAVIG